MNDLNIINDICSIFNFNINEILNIYLYGSQVYECHKSNDIDLIIVRDSLIPYQQFSNDKYDITCYNVDYFQECITNHEVSILECIFLSNDKKIIELKKFDFELDLQKLRKSISEKASNSFVKSKKKLTIEKDFNLYIGKKSLFHSLRILLFGIQIATHNRIIDYQAANYLWLLIVETPNTNWEYFNKEFKPLYNELSTQFKKVAPK